MAWLGKKVANLLTKENANDIFRYWTNEENTKHDFENNLCYKEKGNLKSSREVGKWSCFKKDYYFNGQKQS